MNGSNIFSTLGIVTRDTRETSAVNLREAAAGSFIFEVPRALAREVCHEMVRRFEACGPEQYAGRVGHHANLDTSVKRSTDLVMSGKSHWKDLDGALFRSLVAALDALTRRHPFFGGRFKDIGYAVQRTRPGEFYHWHIDGGSHDLSHRQLVAIWYLNDVEGPGGETEFRYQGVKVTPEEGKLLLFPPFWTHEHRGVVLDRGVKYIATTWVVFA